MKPMVETYHIWRTQMKEINYQVLIDNLKSMINLLEFDAMRSAGKAKLNSQHLHSLYFILDKYEEKVKVKKPTKAKEE